MNDNLKLFLEAAGQKPTYKAFNAMNLSGPELKVLFDSASDWDTRKRILKHKDCPITLAARASKSSVWYERFVAFFAKPNRLFMWRLGLDDPKSIVRAAAYREALMICSDEDLPGWVSRVKADPWVHNMVRLDTLKSGREEAYT